MNKQQEQIFDELVRAWNSPLVSRHEVERFSGGVIRARSLANMDSQGTGPGKITIGGRVAYRRDDLAKWVALRVKGTC